MSPKSISVNEIKPTNRPIDHPLGPWISRYWVTCNLIIILWTWITRDHACYWDCLSENWFNLWIENNSTNVVTAISTKPYSVETSKKVVITTGVDFSEHRLNWSYFRF